MSGKLVARSETMSLYDSGQAPEAWHLFRKVFLLFLLVLAVALGLVILFRLRMPLPPLLFSVFADASLGLLAGLGTRFALRRRHWLLQSIASAAASIVGLAVLGYFTDWRAGIGPLQAGLVRVNLLNWAHIALPLPLQYTRSTMDLLDLAHLVIAVDISWIALRAWKRGPRVLSQPYAAAPVQRNSVPVPLVQQSAVPSSAPVARVRVRPHHTTRPVVKRRILGRPLVSTGAAAVRPARTRSRRWNPMRRKPAVQLAVYQEHRCPYCLEDVNRNDPRGTVECPICHTLHHKDCWDITGTCQVPHLNT